MGTDVGEAGPSEPDSAESPEPPKRRTSFVPPETPGAASDLHDDDELAGALENEVSLLTASLPIIRPESLFLSVPPAEPPYEPHTDAEREIAAQAESGDTLAAIERLEALLSGEEAAVRAGTAQPKAAPDIGQDSHGDDRLAEGRSPASVGIEQSTAEPTAPHSRTRHTSRLFWLWFSAGAMVLVGLGAALVATNLH